jgi:hypothetical protein
MKTNHTPGPWNVEENSSPPLIWGNDYEKPIAEVELHRSYASYGDGEAQANAQLIAAAPELLDACMVALGILDTGTYAAAWVRHDAAKQLRAAIAKAKGEDAE